jgi:hypothetical protein
MRRPEESESFLADPGRRWSHLIGTSGVSLYAAMSTWWALTDPDYVKRAGSPVLFWGVIALFWTLGIYGWSRVVHELYRCAKNRTRGR